MTTRRNFAKSCPRWPEQFKSATRRHEGWIVSAGLIYALNSSLTPTDPTLLTTIVGGKYADKHVRHFLAAKGGCSNGVAFPYLILHPKDETVMRGWVFK